MKPLVLHDYVTQKGGAERVAALLARDFGEGSLVTSAYSPANAHDVFHTLNVKELAPWLPDYAKTNRALLAPVAATVFANYRPRADVVICSSSGWSHWVATDSPTLVYCHTPPRWLWAHRDYFSRLPGSVVSLLDNAMGPLRRRDVGQAHRRTRYVANSSVSQRRLREAYGIDAEIVFPPVTLDTHARQRAVPWLEPGYFLLIARSRGYKNTESIVDLFRTRNVGSLVIVGGQQEASDPASPVHKLGRVPEDVLRWLYQNCRAILALSHEDFGLTPIEGHLFGKPTIALRAGGYLDTCVEDVNAVFVDTTAPEAIKKAVHRLQSSVFDEEAIKRTTQRFTEHSFRAQITAIAREIAE